MNRNEKAGRLDRRIVVQRATTAADAHGTPIETWADLVSTWAAVEYIQTGTGEEYRDAVHLSTNTVVFTIRHRPGILVTDRIVYAGENHDILSISEASGVGNVQKAQSSRGAFLRITTEKRK